MSLCMSQSVSCKTLLLVIQYLLHWWQRCNRMATSTSSLPLPEITTDDFERSWTRFHLVAAASKWDDEKKLLMLPALLRGKLVEIFISLSAEEKETLTKL